MRKVAIVGVEGSGKTVMLAGLGDLYSRPDDKGYFLVPKDFNTSSYVAELMGRLRSGIWPAATADDVFQGLEWTLRRRSDTGGRPTDICELSCLDFPGEVYRKAFVENANTVAGITLTSAGNSVSEEMQRQIESLWSYIERADCLIVLVNLSDVITRGLADRRVLESIWVTSSILEQALKERPGRVVPKTAIVLSQADSYEATIKACGGPKGVLEKYLPQVYNSYDWLDIFAAYAIDKTRLDDNGKIVPDPLFTTEGLRPIMTWLRCEEFSDNAEKYAGTSGMAGFFAKGSGFLELIAGVACVGGLLLFISLNHAAVPGYNRWMTVGLLLLFSFGIWLTCRGFRILWSKSCWTLLCTVAAIVVIVRYVAQFVYQDAFLDGLSAFIGLLLKILQ